MQKCAVGLNKLHTYLEPMEIGVWPTWALLGRSLPYFRCVHLGQGWAGVYDGNPVLQFVSHTFFTAVHSTPPVLSKFVLCS